MNKNFEKILNEFERIKEKGWISSCLNSTGSIGTTFEKELGLSENNSFYGEYRNVNDKRQFKYTEIILFALKDFEFFLYLIENDEISLSMAYRINKSSQHYGKSSSKNIVFAISISKLDKLYDRIK